MIGTTCLVRHGIANLQKLGRLNLSFQLGASTQSLRDPSRDTQRSGKFPEERGTYPIKSVAQFICLLVHITDVTRQSRVKG